MRAKSPRRKNVKIPTAASLAASALYYLSRFAASEASLRRVLESRIKRVSICNEEFANDAALQKALRAAIDNIITGHRKTGVLNDTAFANMKVASLRRSGRSARAIRLKLGQSGIKGDMVNEALDTAADGMEGEEAELQAATVFAKRKRLGPFRKSEADLKQKQKEFATMARAGFTLDTARKVLGREAEEEF